MGFLRKNKLLLLSVLAFASLIPLAYYFLLGWRAGGGDGFGALFTINQLLGIYAMLRIGKSLINLHKEVAEAINKNLGYGIVACGFYYFTWGFLF